MQRLLLFFAVLQISYCSCPSGFDLVSNGQCRSESPYAIMTLKADGAPKVAYDKCNEVQALPVIIHNDEQQSYWRSQATKTSQYLILGLGCNTANSQWRWMDGTPLDYKPPKGSYDADLDESCTADDRTRCVWRLNTGDGIWMLNCAHNWDGVYAVFCTTQLHQPTGDGCDSVYDDSEEGLCYQVHSTALTWQDAQTTCRNLGANVASIHNPQENSFIRRLAVSNGAVNGVYLGATTSGKGNSFGWIDGSDWDYENFSPGNPFAGEGDCLAMDTFSASGEWMNIDCSSKLPVACAREATPRPACTSGPWKEGEVIYSPGYPYDASLPCDYYLTVASGKKVQVEVLLLEANTCCDRLVLEDAKLGGNIVANLTGEITDRTYTTKSTNFMRVSWQPNGGVNVRGMMFTYHGV